MQTLKQYIKARYQPNAGFEKVDFQFPNGCKNIQAGYYNVYADKKVFAFIGYPKDYIIGKCPAVILVHGGGGQAFYEWIQKWTNKGYIAIAPDFDGHYAKSIAARREVNPFGGPNGYGMGNYAFAEPDPWTYFSILSIKKAIDCLLNIPEVDETKVALEGISWGGILGLILSSVENRISALIIKYASAYHYRSNYWGFIDFWKKMDKEQKRLYREKLDPKNYIKDISVPILFLTGVNDVCFNVYNRQKTIEKIKAKTYYSYRFYLTHGHESGWETDESIVFCDDIFDRKALERPVFDFSQDEIFVCATSNCKDFKLVYTTDKKIRKDVMEWVELPFETKIAIPENATAYVVTYQTSTGYRFSSQMTIKKS